MTKKITILMLLLLSLTAVGFGQGVYQFPNSDFENWHTVTVTSNYSSSVPTSWHSFSEADGEFAQYNLLMKTTLGTVDS